MSVIGMESELQRRLLSSNKDIDRQTSETCEICFDDTQEVKLIPCDEGEKHPKICDACLDGCKKLCPYCRRTLTTATNCLTDNVLLCINYLSLPTYFYLLMSYCS